MKLQKRVRKQLEKALSSLTAGLKELDKGLGVATPTTNPNGSSYDLRNPACIETCNGLAEHIDVHPIHGSKVIYVYTAQEILNRLLNEAD